MNAGSTEVASVETVRRGTQAISIQRNADGDRNFITVDAGGFEQIDLSFQDECWVEVVDGQQGLIYHDLNTADDILTLYGTAPFKVLLGKATGVEMIYNGRPFDLQPYIGQDKTAKLTVSE
jgi:cytoskeleton protein RodZ